MWLVLPEYAKENYSVPENRFIFIPMANAVMVVVFRVAVTRVTKCFPTLLVLRSGAVFYMLAAVGMGFGAGVRGFWVFIFVMTIGELSLAPAASTYAANLAPVDKRGRYMRIFGLAWQIALGTGPILGVCKTICWGRKGSGLGEG